MGKITQILNYSRRGNALKTFTGTAVGGRERDHPETTNVKGTTGTEGKSGIYVHWLS